MYTGGAMARVVLVWVFVLTVAATACGGGSDERGVASDVSVTASPSPRRSPLPERNRPVRVTDLDLAACDIETSGDQRLRVIAHEPKSELHLPTIEAALGPAIDQAAAIYGWTPTEPVCVHVFASDNAYLQGLNQLAELPADVAFEYRATLGTVGSDGRTGRDAIYLNTVIPLSENWFSFLATHEYYHIVQGHVGGTRGGFQQQFPSWFLEGMADWEAVKLAGNPHPTWLQVLTTEERAGRALSLRELVSWDQWRDVERRSPRYWKARGAIAYLEELAGPDAAARILRDNAFGDLSGFQFAFEEVSGVTVQDFEEGLLPFLEKLLIEEASPQP